MALASLVSPSLVAPSLVITPGEPSGVGPELAIQLAQKNWPAGLIFIADPDLLLERAKLLDLPLKISLWQENQKVPPHQAGTIVCHPVKLAEKSQPGILNKNNSDYVLNCLSKAHHLITSNILNGVVTGPIHKGIINQASNEGSNQAGTGFSGHTEFFANAAGCEQVVMVLATEGMRVALATTHLPLSQVPDAITQEKLKRVISIIYKELATYFGIKSPKIRVLGLNPHAGENGYMGDEEITQIGPVIQHFAKQGLQIEGPCSADTAFGSHQKPAEVDLILAMYHDQGLPVLKYRGFGQAINITLGLPYVRTSVDHGTALDLAGTGKANVKSFEFALEQAIVMSQQKVMNQQSNKVLHKREPDS